MAENESGANINFDEMDIESRESLLRGSFKSKESEMMKSEMLMRTVNLDDGTVGYIFSKTNVGSRQIWHCHVCGFKDLWEAMLTHVKSKMHEDMLNKGAHPRVNFTRTVDYEMLIPEVESGQPVPPGTEDVLSSKCYITATLDNFPKPLIGLEYLFELIMEDPGSEPRYLCALCDKRGDPRSILQHLTSVSHYTIYLRKYFTKLSALVGHLPKSLECKPKVGQVVTHVIAKIEERYGRLKPSAILNEIMKIPEQRTILLQKISNGPHITEQPEDSDLAEMITIEYVEKPELLAIRFPVKSKIVKQKSPTKTTTSEKRSASRERERSRSNDKPKRASHPRNLIGGVDDDVIFMGPVTTSKKSYKYSHRRDYSPTHYSRSRSRTRRNHSRSRSPSHSHYYRHGRGSSSYNPYNRRYHKPRSHSRSRSHSPKHHTFWRPYYRGRGAPRKHYRGGSHYRSRSRSLILPYDHSKYHGTRTGSRSRSRSKNRSKERRHRGRDHRHGSAERKSPSGYYRRSRSSSSLSYRGSRERSYEPEEPIVLDEKDNAEETPLQRELVLIENEMAVRIDYYKMNPEQHPAYQEEWKKFWNKRYKEIQAEGKQDPNKYDYKPEWIQFWSVRMKELFDEELFQRQADAKVKFNASVQRASSDTEKEKLPEKQPNVTISDIKMTWKALTGSDINAPGSSKKSPSPGKVKNRSSSRSQESISSGSLPSPPSESQERRKKSIPRSYSRSRSRSRAYSRSRSRSKSRSRSGSRFSDKFKYRKRSPMKINIENSLNVITLLRQFTIMEYNLGSLASHVMTLLTTGLAMEKRKEGSSKDLLTTENILFLETCREKLKGQLLAGVVPKNLVRSALFAIKNTEKLLKRLPTRPTSPLLIPIPPKSMLPAIESTSSTPGATRGAVGSAPPSAPSQLPPPSPRYPQAPLAPHIPAFGYRDYHPYTMRGSYFPPRDPLAYRDPVLLHDAFLRDLAYRDPLAYRDMSLREARFFREMDVRERERILHTSGHLPPDLRGRSRSKSRSRSRSHPRPSGPRREVTPKRSERDVSRKDEVSVDKIIIARQIAGILTKEGRTNVSQGELELLINAVVRRIKELNADGKYKSAESVVENIMMEFDRKTTSHVRDEEERKRKATFQNTPRPTTSHVRDKEEERIKTRFQNTPRPTTSHVRDEEEERRKATFQNTPRPTTSHVRDEEEEKRKTTFQNTPRPRPLPTENLSNKDLISLMHNFQNLTKDEQVGLKDFIGELCKTDPGRIARIKHTLVTLRLPLDLLLRHFPKSGDTTGSTKKVVHEKPSQAEDDDDDDNYTLDDVYRAASKNVYNAEPEHHHVDTSSVEITDETRNLLKDVQRLLGDKAGACAIPISESQEVVEKAIEIKEEPSVTSSDEDDKGELIPLLSEGPVPSSVFPKRIMNPVDHTSIFSEPPMGSGPGIPPPSTSSDEDVKPYDLRPAVDRPFEDRNIPSLLAGNYPRDQGVGYSGPPKLLDDRRLPSYPQRYDEKNWTDSKPQLMQQRTQFKDNTGLSMWDDKPTDSKYPSVQSQPIMQQRTQFGDDTGLLTWNDKPASNTRLPPTSSSSATSFQDYKRAPTFGGAAPSSTMVEKRTHFDRQPSLENRPRSALSMLGESFENKPRSALSMLGESFENKPRSALLILGERGLLPTSKDSSGLDRRTVQSEDNQTSYKPYTDFTPGTNFSQGQPRVPRGPILSTRPSAPQQQQRPSAPQQQQQRPLIPPQQQRPLIPQQQQRPLIPQQQQRPSAPQQQQRPSAPQQQHRPSALQQHQRPLASQQQQRAQLQPRGGFSFPSARNQFPRF